MTMMMTTPTTQAPTLYDDRDPIDYRLSEIGLATSRPMAGAYQERPDQVQYWGSQGGGSQGAKEEREGKYIQLFKLGISHNERL